MSIRSARLERILLPLTVATLWGVSSLAGAQTLQPKAVQPAPAPQQRQQAPSPPAQPAPQWAVACTNTQAGLDCSVGQSRVFQETGRNVQVGVALRIPPDTRKPNLMLQVPLGVSLPKGLTVQFGGDNPKAIAFQSCSVNGCLAEYPITETEIASLLNGADLTLSVHTSNNTPLTFRISAAGFANAYAKMTSR
jgi:invasion protein IalB